MKHNAQVGEVLFSVKSLTHCLIVGEVPYYYVVEFENGIMMELEKAKVNRRVSYYYVIPKLSKTTEG